MPNRTRLCKFLDGSAPDAVTEAQLIAWFMAQRRAQLAALQRARVISSRSATSCARRRHTL